MARSLKIQQTYHLWHQFLHTRNAQKSHPQDNLTLQDSYSMYDACLSVGLPPSKSSMCLASTEATHAVRVHERTPQTNRFCPEA